MKDEATQALTTLSNLSGTLQPGGTFAHRRYSKVLLDCLGTILRRMAAFLGKAKEGQVFGPVKLSLKLAGDSVIPKIRSADTEKPVNFSQVLEILRQCRQDLTSALSIITAEPGHVPQETHAGACLTAAGILIRARWTIEAGLYNAILSPETTTDSSASESPAASQAPAPPCNLTIIARNRQNASARKVFRGLPALCQLCRVKATNPAGPQTESA